MPVQNVNRLWRVILYFTNSTDPLSWTMQAFWQPVSCQGGQLMALWPRGACAMHNSLQQVTVTLTSRIFWISSRWISCSSISFFVLKQREKTPFIMGLFCSKDCWQVPSIYLTQNAPEHQHDFTRELRLTRTNMNNNDNSQIVLYHDIVLLHNQM